PSKKGAENMIWQDDFTGGDMDSVEKLSDGLHLKDKDALLITGPGEHVLVPGDPVFNVGGDVSIEFLACGTPPSTYKALGALNNRTRNPELLLRTWGGDAFQVFTNDGSFNSESFVVPHALPDDVFYLTVSHRSSDGHTSVTLNGVEIYTTTMRWNITGILNFTMGAWMSDGVNPTH